ncbi:MAG: PIN domain-containing protein [Terrimicrobiaceae bacterium]
MNFLDTNILLYAGWNAPEDARKKQIASAIIASVEFAISTQVVQEFIANALGKKSLGFTGAGIEATLESLRSITVLPVTYGLVLQAWRLHRRHAVSQWDATILAAALELGCQTLYSEGLNHGQDYDGVKVVNPFLLPAL